MKAKVLLTLTILLFACTLVFGQIQFKKKVTATALIASPSLKITWVGNSSEVSNIDWGTVYNGSSYSKGFNVLNVGNVPLTLTMTHTLDSSIGSFSWDLEGYSLAVEETKPFWLTLTILGTTTALGFDAEIAIVGIG